MHITSGLSNPWYQKRAAEVSGFGCEIMLKTPDKARWSRRLLSTLALYVFNYGGTLSPGVRVSLNAPLASRRTKHSALDKVLLWYADEAADAWYELPSGGFGIFLAQGITTDENEFAESIADYGTWGIQAVLKQTGIGQITDPARRSVMAYESTGPILENVRQYVRNFRALSQPGASAQLQ